ncbi:MAG: NAD(P)H-binding protein [Steroidobacter sp.]
MFLVTDAAGHVGKAVIAELANHSVAVRVIGQDPAELLAAPPNVEIVRCNPADEMSLQQALQGVEAVLLACPYTPQITEGQMRLVAAAKRAGVARLVQLSGVGANAEMCCARMLRWFGEAEASVAASGLKVTRLRPTMQMQMLLEFAPSIAQQGLIAGPFRSTRWTWVDARDVAAVAVAALRDASHADQTYIVTGAESVSYHDVAERLGGVLGKSIRYTDITANEARGWLQAKGVPPVMIEAKLELWDACASNLINVAPTNVVREVTGREPRSLEDFATDYRTSFGSL